MFVWVFCFSIVILIFIRVFCYLIVYSYFIYHIRLFFLSISIINFTLFYLIFDFYLFISFILFYLFIFVCFLGLGGWVGVGGFRDLRALTDKSPRDDLEPGRSIHYDTSQIQFTFGHASQHSMHFLTSDLSSNCRTYSDKSLMRLSSDVLRKLIMGLPCSTKFPPLLGLWLAGNCPHICRQPSAQIELKLGERIPGPITLCSCSAEFPSFPGLWLVEYLFSLIFTQTANCIKIKFG